MDGVLRCSRYAFGPNRLHYCGPDATQELVAQMGSGTATPILTGILSRFETLYPYLQLIATANHIRDPFDERVVEAYWIGNSLLDTVRREQFYWYLKDTLHIPARIGQEAFGRLLETLGRGVIPHHAFHVLGVWERGLHRDDRHTRESLAECLVNVGEVTTVSGPWITLSTRPLVADAQGRWSFGPAIERRLTRQLGVYDDIESVAVGDWVSFHWGVPCEVLTPEQATQLERFTLRSIQAVNASYKR